MDSTKASQHTSTERTNLNVVSLLIPTEKSHHIKDISLRNILNAVLM